MTLKVVQDTSTNWTAQEWRVLDRMKKNYADMDERSGRPWKLGDDLLILDPPGAEGVNSGRLERIRDAALEVGCAPGSLRQYGEVAAAWPAAARVAAVSYSVFRTLVGDPDRERILAKLLKVKDPIDITVDDARRAIGMETTRPLGLDERAITYRRFLSRFRGQRLTTKSRHALEQLRFEIDVLLGEAEEEAV